jgi:hypothetical protein
MAKATCAAEARRLTDIPNIGKAAAADLVALGFSTPADVQRMDPMRAYDRLRDAQGRLHDPCVLDTFMAAHDFMNGGAPRPWWHFTARRKQLLASLLVAGAAATGTAQAAEHRDPTSGCVVQAPSYLASNDFIFSYEGACRNGLAEGQGKAIWTLRYSPQNRHVWAGRFNNGVFLPEPSQGLSARVLKDETLLFDLGALPKLKGLSPRLAVEASGEMTEAADPCQPYTLWVLQGSGEALEADDVAQTLLRSAADKLKLRCGMDRLLAMPRSTAQRTHLRVRVVPQAALELDRYGNPQGTIVEANVPLQPNQALEQYSNQVAAKRREEQARAERQLAQQANAQRLQAFAKPAGAQVWASIPALAQNPFRFQDQVVLTAVSLDEVQSPQRARVTGLGRMGSYQFATLEGEGLGRWAPGSRVLAVRVLGRLPATDELHPSGLRLQLVAELACAERDCSDRLYLPKPPNDGEAP